MIACYIIYSPLKDRFYIGATQEDILSRVEKHNSKSYGETATSFTEDWGLYFFIPCAIYTQAVNIERHIKRMKSKKYIYNLKEFPQIAQKLIEKYKLST